MRFRVSRDTLIPRGDSEVLIETLASLYAPPTPLNILDLGTGSGCLLLAALSEFPNATGVGIDISPGALDIARENAGQLGLSDRSTFLKYDMEQLSPARIDIESPLQTGFDVILCNPPYIPLNELPLIAPDVLAHEPHGALFADGPDAFRNLRDAPPLSPDLGLRFYKSLARSARELLRVAAVSRSSVLMEIGSTQQAMAVRDLFVTAGFAFDRFLFDAAGRHRGVLCSIASGIRSTGMKQSLAARQAALLQQNAELDAKVEAIEQRRQQQLLSAIGKAASMPSRAADQDDDDDSNSNNDPMDRSVALSLALTESPPSPTADEPAAAKKEEVSPASVSPRARLEHRRSGSSVVSGSRSNAKRTAAIRRRRSDDAQLAAVASEASASASASVDSKGEGEGGSSGVAPPRAVQEDGGIATPDGLGLEATVRYQKARLRVLQDELDAATSAVKELRAEQTALHARIEELQGENAGIKKKQAHTQQLLEKQQELTYKNATHKLLESQLATANAKMEELQRAEKQTSQQFRSKDVRLNRALEELEKVKAQLQEERRAHGEQTISKAEFDQVVKENKRLEKQKNELLVAFKKQMKLIDILKRQRIHMEAAKMLSFTEEEFSKTLELG
ncbi:hypothetical protein P43SY_000370 [Pythium insidiosum]|uniref:Methyltransferase domain-containing protein n=1 Tax=Pythium insidiosum TaxID=114742 RepID=A0AAD5QDE2_PYTIN|nr:hypothetical protein P43SY_000370 [Pythium insidiosum]